MSGSIWDQVLSRIESKVGSHSFHTWFKPTAMLADDGRRVSVRVPNLLFTEWLPKHYSVVLAEALRDVGRANTELVFIPEEAKTVAAPRRRLFLTPCGTSRLRPRWSSRRSV